MNFDGCSLLAWWAERRFILAVAHIRIYNIYIHIYI
jgi:hypothetical protein